MNNHSAFPTDGAHNSKGLSKIEIFTMAAMQGLLSASWYTDSIMHEKLAEQAVSAAKATLSELSKQQ